MSFDMVLIPGGTFTMGSDAGEPGRTAGPPILSALQAARVSDASAVVVRYFGGVKLGTAGLARAYREAARAAVEALRSGRGARPADVDPGSPFAHLAESVNRLGQEVAARLGEADGAGEGLKTLVEAIRDVAVLTTDADGDLRSANAAATALLGWGEEEILSRPVAALFDDAAWRDLLPRLARRSLRERGLEARSVLKRRDGTTFHADVSVRLLRGRGGEASGFLLLARDADARVRVEEELRESEARHRALVEGLADGVFVARDGRELWLIQTNSNTVFQGGATRAERAPERN